MPVKKVRFDKNNNKIPRKCNGYLLPPKSRAARQSM